MEDYSVSMETVCEECGDIFYFEPKSNREILEAKIKLLSEKLAFQRLLWYTAEANQIEEDLAKLKAQRDVDFPKDSFKSEPLLCPKCREKKKSEKTLGNETYQNHSK